jgi:hypothetical protein
MNLGQAIHTQWAADTALNTLLPAATKLSTGTAFDATMPYATILRTGTESVSTSNDGVTVANVQVTVKVFSDNYDTGAAIADAVVDAFDAKELALTGSDKVLSISADEPVEEQDAETLVWTWSIVLTCLVQKV